MLLSNMIEYVKLEFPKVNSTKILFDMNRALQDFCLATNILYRKVTLTQDDRVQQNSNTYEMCFTLPTTVYQIIEVEELAENEYYVADNVLHIQFVDNGIQEFNVWYTAYPKVMAFGTDQPPIPDEFHDNLVDSVLSTYLASSNGSQLELQMRLASYKDGVKKGKQYANLRKYRNTNYTVEGDAPTGEVTDVLTAYKSGVTLVPGVQIVTLQKNGVTVTFSSKDFALILNGNGVEVTEYLPDANDPYSGRTINSVQVISAADNPNFEYIAVGK